MPVLAMFDWIKKNLGRKQPAADRFEQFVREFVAEYQRKNVQPKSYESERPL